MATSGFVERLLRELKRNKAKSAALAALCLVAMYFWLPLVTRMFVKKKDNAAPTVETTDIAAGIVAPAAEAEKEVPDFDWQQFLTWMEKESRMTVISLSDAARDPFQAPPASESQEATESAAAAAAASDPQLPAVNDPTALGLELRATFVGGQKSAANINGTIYRLGDIVPLPNANPIAAETTDGFQLFEVKPGFVTLRSSGRLFHLELHRETETDGRIIIKAASPSSGP